MPFLIVLRLIINKIDTCPGRVLAPYRVECKVIHISFGYFRALLLYCFLVRCKNFPHVETTVSDYIIYPLNSLLNQSKTATSCPLLLYSLYPTTLFIAYYSALFIIFTGTLFGLLISLFPILTKDGLFKYNMLNRTILL